MATHISAAGGIPLKHWVEAQSADPTVQGWAESLGDTAPALDATQTEEEGAFFCLLPFYQSQRIRMPGKLGNVVLCMKRRAEKRQINKRTDAEMATPFCWTPSNLH